MHSILTNVEYNQTELLEIIIKNILKMLERRTKIESYEEEFKKIKNNNNNTNNNIIEIKAIDNEIINIYFINSNITTIVSGTPLEIYLSENLNVRKIIIAKVVSKKVVRQLYYEYQNVEFFFENEMLEDIPSKIFIPKHILLTKEEKKELAEVFDEKDIGKILLFDIMTRYYNANVGDIFRIIRPSLTAGYNIYYRKVINGTIDIIL